jgi:hypothetical protein
MHEQHGHAGAIELEGGLGRGVLDADDDDPLAVVGTRFAVEVRDVRQVLTGNGELVDQVVRTRREDDGAYVGDSVRRDRTERSPGTRRRLRGEGPVTISPKTTSSLKASVMRRE